MKSKPISEKTRAAILEAAWRLIAERGRTDVAQTEIAAAAGVSRQTIFYAFGNRSGLLTAMLRHRDEASTEVSRLWELGQTRQPNGATLMAYVGTWLDYLPQVYPVGSLLHAAGFTDAEARAAIDDRMIGALLAGFRRLFRKLGQADLLTPGTDPEAAAELVWSAVHFANWQLLVIDCGWTPDAFRASRLDLVASLSRIEP